MISGNRWERWSTRQSRGTERGLFGGPRNRSDFANIGEIGYWPIRVISVNDDNRTRTGFKRLARQMCVPTYDENSSYSDSYFQSILESQLAPLLPESAQTTHHWVWTVAQIVALILGACLIAIGLFGIAAAINSGESAVAFVVGIVLYMWGLNLFN
jgi:hypothetical protein